MTPLERENELELLRRKYLGLRRHLTESGRRIWAATEARSYGYGGIALIAEATGLAYSTIRAGMKELVSSDREPIGIRKFGGGRKKKRSPELIDDLKGLVEPEAKGDPENPLLWTAKSVRNLADALSKKGHCICPGTVGTILKELGYSLQANKKTLEGTSHVDRDAQFRFINAAVLSALQKGQPAISVDTKKKENVGKFKNPGREYSQKGTPIPVKGHDFPDKRLGKAVPYGIYDIGLNKGWVSVGISGDTAAFAVNAIRAWWYQMGEEAYPDRKVTDLTITADCGGSNGYRVKLWKRELQVLADQTGLKIHVRHFPPGTSKWNKIEHRMFSYISKNWRGRPLVSLEVIVQLIGATRSTSGLEIRAILDQNVYELGIDVRPEEMQSLNIVGDKFHPEWNYTIAPRVR